VLFTDMTAVEVPDGELDDDLYAQPLRHRLQSMTEDIERVDDIERIEERAESLVEGHVEMMRALISLRNHHHLTQEAVAERMGVTQPTVAAFERYDSNPTLATIRRYALAVDARLVTKVIDDCAHRDSSQFDAIVKNTAIPTWAPVIRFGAWRGVVRPGSEQYV
jgi:transcriptional regulator with XRE-family HTH domain